MKFKSNSYHIIFDVWYVNLFIFMYNTAAVTIPEKKCNIEKSHYLPPKIKLTLEKRSFLSFDVKWCNALM